MRINIAEATDIRCKEPDDTDLLDEAGVCNKPATRFFRKPFPGSYHAVCERCSVVFRSAVWNYMTVSKDEYIIGKVMET